MYSKHDYYLHIFYNNLLFRYEYIPEKWEAPTQQPYKVQTDLYSFLTEAEAYDQYCVSAETGPNAIQVQFWQNTLPEPTDLESRDVILGLYITV